MTDLEKVISLLPAVPGCSWVLRGQRLSLWAFPQFDLVDVAHGLVGTLSVDTQYITTKLRALYEASKA